MYEIYRPRQMKPLRMANKNGRSVVCLGPFASNLEDKLRLPVQRSGRPGLPVDVRFAQVGLHASTKKARDKI